MKFWVSQGGRRFEVTIERHGEMWRGVVIEDELRCFECWSPDFEEARQSCLVNALRYVAAGVYPDWDAGVKQSVTEMREGRVLLLTPPELEEASQLEPHSRIICPVCEKFFYRGQDMSTYTMGPHRTSLHTSCLLRLQRAGVPLVGTTTTGTVAGFTDPPDGGPIVQS